MKTFDLFLVPPEGKSIEPEALIECLGEIPHLLPDPVDPSRLYYTNDHSGVRFFLLIDEQYVPPPTDDEEYAYGGDGEERLDVEDEEEEDDDDQDEDDDETTAVQIEVPPVTINIPLFHPRFFAREALEIVRHIQERLGLLAIDPQDGGAGAGDPGDYEVDELLASWVSSHAPILALLEDPDTVQRWTAKTSARYAAYCAQRPRLLEELDDDGIYVPQLYAARHHGEIKSLCIWRSDRPAVLPRCDLVLLERVRERRGLLGRRKKIDEILISGDRLWEILSPFSDVRSSPVQVLVFRRADNPPAQLQNDLDDLEGESIHNAKRTDLAGIIDFEIPVASLPVDENDEGVVG